MQRHTITSTGTIIAANSPLYYCMLEFHMFLAWQRSRHVVRAKHLTVDDGGGKISHRTVKRETWLKS